MERGITTNEIISQLSKSTHGNLSEYVETTRTAARSNPEFLAHLIAWNFIKGQVRDSKVTLPVISLSSPGYPDEFRDNSLAHLALLDPRNLLRGLRFAKEVRQNGASGKNALNRLVERYLRTREENWGIWQRNAVQHRKSLKELYAFCRIKPAATANAVLFDQEYPRGSIFESIAQLKNMSASEAAGTILNRKIPFLIASGALGPRMKEPAIILALIERMTPTELVTNTKMLQKLGVRKDPALRGAFESALQRAAAGKANTLKTSRAAEALEDEDVRSELAEKLKALQEKQINALGGIDGNWLVLADKSGSMAQAIDVARHVAATLARFVKGKVHLVFFDTAPRYVEATGKTLDELVNITRNVVAGGGTSIGCGLAYAIEKRFEIDGIAVVSDGGENTAPWFVDYYAAMTKDAVTPPPVYFYHCAGESDTFSYSMGARGIPMNTFDIQRGVDYYSLPNICLSMRASRYALTDEVMDTPLLTQDEVFNKLIGKKKEDLVYA